MKTFATLVAAACLSISLAGTASATAPGAEIGPKASTESSIAPAACYYQYQWFTFGGQTGYTRQLICY
jgi:hypothetical protein